jgi:uncharacterized membrane protein
MKENAFLSVRRTGPVFLSLALASGVGIALVVARVIASHRFAYSNLVWNLFLAWLPFLFALCAGRLGASRGRFLFCAFLWLLFLPNSPYLVTDLVHLRPRPPVPFWFDILLIQSFVLTGLLLGFLSLHLMHRRVSHSFGWRSGWLFTLVVLGLTGFGIYLGRFERWNSWDLFTSPVALVTDVLNLLIHPRANKTAFVFTTLCALFLGLSYLTLYSLPAFSRTDTSSTEGDPNAGAPRN